MGLFITCRSCFSSSVVIFGLIFPPATGTKHKNFRGPPANPGLSHTAGGCHHWKLPLRTIVPMLPSAVLSFHLRRKRTIESNLFCAVQALYYLVKDGHAKWRHTQAEHTHTPSLLGTWKQSSSDMPNSLRNPMTANNGLGT